MHVIVVRSNSCSKDKVLITLSFVSVPILILHITFVAQVDKTLMTQYLCSLVT